MSFKIPLNPKAIKVEPKKANRRYRMYLVGGPEEPVFDHTVVHFDEVYALYDKQRETDGRLPDKVNFCREDICTWTLEIVKPKK